MKAEAEEKARREAENKLKAAAANTKRLQDERRLQEQRDAELLAMSQSAAQPPSNTVCGRRMSLTSRVAAVAQPVRSSAGLSQDRDRKDQEAKTRAEDARRRAEERVKSAQAKARERAKAQSKADKFLSRLASST